MTPLDVLHDARDHDDNNDDDDDDGEIPTNASPPPHSQVAAVSFAEDKRRHEMVVKMKYDFEKRWGLTARGCCQRAGETSGERLERIVRRKVRKDVKMAHQWDEMLAACEGDEREMRLIELARFEHLSGVEQARSRFDQFVRHCRRSRRRLRATASQRARRAVEPRRAPRAKTRRPREKRATPS